MRRKTSGPTGSANAGDGGSEVPSATNSSSSRIIRFLEGERRWAITLRNQPDRLARGKPGLQPEPGAERVGAGRIPRRPQQNLKRSLEREFRAELLERVPDRCRFSLVAAKRKNPAITNERLSDGPGGKQVGPLHAAHRLSHLVPEVGRLLTDHAGRDWSQPPQPHETLKTLPHGRRGKIAGKPRFASHLLPANLFPNPASVMSAQMVGSLLAEQHTFPEPDSPFKGVPKGDLQGCRTVERQPTAPFRLKLFGIPAGGKRQADRLTSFHSNTSRSASR